MYKINSKKSAYILYAIYRKFYISLYWKTPKILPRIKYPQIVELELTNNCNLSCTHCHRKIMDRELGYMDFSVFKKIVDELAKYKVSFIRIVGQGESSLHPKLRNMMEYLAGKKIKVEFTTNGYLLEKYTPEEILSWNIDTLGISVDGYDKKTYGSIRVGGDYDKLKENVKKLYDKKHELEYSHPKIKIRNVLFPEYSKEVIDAFKTEWLQISDYVSFNTFNQFDKIIAYEELKQCTNIFFHAHVRWNGMVPICSHQFLYKKNEWIGNLNYQTLSEIWQNEKIMTMRLLHKRKDFEKLGGCNNCFHVQKRDTISGNYKMQNKTNSNIKNIINKVIKIT